jgi:HAD superfamily hydrolase (TIGR01509 family)
VVFDVDGTLVDSERDGHRVAFNRAFDDAGLPYHWDVEQYGELLRVTGGAARIAFYLEQHGLGTNERQLLSRRLHSRKTEIFTDMVEFGQVPPRPGVGRLLAELQDAGVRLAIATTGTATWVHPLLDSVFGDSRFEVVVTSREASALKPDPEAYQLVLERLGVPACAAVALEDSRNGLLSAKAAGMACVVVVNDYSRDQDLSDADLVLDGFGLPGAPAGILADPYRLNPPQQLDVETLGRVCAARHHASAPGRAGVCSATPRERTGKLG